MLGRAHRGLHTPDRGSAGLQFARYHRGAMAITQELFRELSSLWREARRTSDRFALGARPGESRLSALDQEIALELGHRVDHRHRQLAGRRVGGMMAPHRADWRCRAMAPDTLITVRRHWNDYRKAQVRFSDLAGWHRSSYSGGVGTASPKPMIAAYVYCNAFVSGEVAHSCSHGPGPHRIKVVVVQRDNDRAAVRDLKVLADVGGKR